MVVFLKNFKVMHSLFFLYGVITSVCHLQIAATFLTRILLTNDCISCIRFSLSFQYKISEALLRLSTITDSCLGCFKMVKYHLSILNIKALSHAISSWSVSVFAWRVAELFYCRNLKVEHLTARGCGGSKAKASAFESFAIFFAKISKL